MSASPDPLPPALPAMWRALKLGYRDQPGLLVAALGLVLLAALPDALLALWLALLGQGVLVHDNHKIVIAALGLGVSATATWFLRVVSARVLRRFRDRVTVALEAHVARLQAAIETIAHQERPELLDRLAMLRNQVFVLDHMYMSLFTTCAWILRLGVTVGLLMSIHPAMALLALFALPTVATSSWRPGIERQVEERSAPAIRLAMHLFTSATTAASAKELRLAGIAGRWVERRRAAWERWYAPVAATRWTSAAWHCLGWAIFGAAYVTAVVLVATRPAFGPADVLLALAAGARLSAYIGATVGEIGFLRGFWLEGSRRLAWLEDYAASIATAGDQPAPTRLAEGIRLEGVSFAYPGTDRLVVENVDLTLPAGTVVALVGENGAGKSTLVKLLCKLYEPTGGRILVDGVPLSQVRTEDWR
ncbi:MAG TPA: ABC transporter ATP-binding protein/permease, partial [Thermoanaerobaculia bacterium]|nr:ABC transporter ATP-binding protein/permease [Thermoanaerobaculia bacterium]